MVDFYFNMFYFSDNHDILPAGKRAVNWLNLETKQTHIDGVFVFFKQ